MVGHACLVRAGTAQKGPTVDDELAPAKSAQIGRPVPPAGAAAHEYRIEGAFVVPVHVHDRLGDLARKRPGDEVLPLGESKGAVDDIHEPSIGSAAMALAVLKDENLPPAS